MVSNAVNESVQETSWVHLDQGLDVEKTAAVVTKTVNESEQESSWPHLDPGPVDNTVNPSSVFQITILCILSIM